MAFGIAEIAILVFFVGILALIFVLIYYLNQRSKLPSRLQYYRTQYPTQGEMKLCNNCHAKLDSNWVSCPYCGETIT
jgi:uncharacterized paraquat-inducible protein A